jgi:hypothetical protein
MLAHRMIWEECFGELPNDREIDHVCRNRGCVNPAHLELVTHRENVLRGVSPCALHARKTQCKHGHLFSAANTILVPNGRDCRACKKVRNARYRARHPAKVRAAIYAARKRR